MVKKGGEIIIYKDRHGKKAVDVRLDDGSVWLSQKHLSELFDKDVRTINEHINNVFSEGELKKNSSVIRKFRITASDGKKYNTNFYNLDVIISVGYRVKSLSGTKFRIWATKILRDYTIMGYSINPQRIKENYQEFRKDIDTIMALLPRDKNLDNQSILELVKTFADTWLSLDAYDKDELMIKKVTKRKVKLTGEELAQAIISFKTELIKRREATELFAQERETGSLTGIVGNVMQAFGGHDLYLGLEEKAANLLYFVIKNHPFVDGNKRSAAYAFVWFLRRVKLLNTDKLNPAALTAITLLLAESKPKDKDKMVALVVRMLKK